MGLHSCPFLNLGSTEHQVTPVVTSHLPFTAKLRASCRQAGARSSSSPTWAVLYQNDPSRLKPQNTYQHVTLHVLVMFVDHCFA